MKKKVKYTYDDIFDVSIFLVTNTGDVIEPQEYVVSDEDVVEFIMLTNDVLNSDYDENNSVYIHKDWKRQCEKISGPKYSNSPSGVLWSDEMNLRIYNIQNVEEDYHFTDYDKHHEKEKDLIFQQVNGYKQTQDILMNIGTNVQAYKEKRQKYNTKYDINDYLPALTRTHKTTVDFKGQQLHGYIPSMAQLIFMAENARPINTCIKDVNMCFLDEVLRKVDHKNVLSGNYWSCTVHNDYTMWVWTNDRMDFANKMTFRHVFPIFKLDI